MQDITETPRSRRKKSLLAEAKAYLGGSSKPQPDITMARAQLESALETPLTPKATSGKNKVKKAKRLSIGHGTPEETSPSRKSNHDHRDFASVDEYQSPRAKQKIRRSSTNTSNVTSSAPFPRDSTSVNDISDGAISPSVRSKSKLRSSDGHATGRGRKSRVSSKDKKKLRNNSAGPLMREKVRHSTGMTPKSALSKPRRPSSDTLMDQLGGLTMPLEGKLREPDDSGGAKTRTTVGDDGRIRRVKKDGEENRSGSDDEDGKSRQSSSSRRSKMSTKSSNTKKSTTNKKLKDKSDGKKKLKSPKNDGCSSDLGHGSEHSDLSARTGSRRVEQTERSHRRAGKRTTPTPIDDVSEPNQHLQAMDSPKPNKESKESLQPQESEDNNDLHASFDNLALDTAGSSKPSGVAELQEEVARLNKKIVEMNEDNLKAQFTAQSEAAKLRKELREEKLELQRSQTDRRELRAELRERDVLIDESDRKIQALEKAVESQLDKVDDLEEELRRANEEIFDLEEKLGDMERVLTDSSAVETNALQKEKDLGDKRRERMERRLEEREKELEVREKQLREDRDTLTKEGQPQREVEQLEQDNRMLLKALNREREDAADAAKEKEEEMKKLRQELKLAKLKSYSQMNNGTTNENISKLLQDNVDLQQRFDAEKDKTSTELKKKDDTIARLEDEIKKLNGSSAADGSGNSEGIMEEFEIVKADLLVMRSKLEGAQRRNQILEEDIDHWKSVNCNLEDEVADWKSQVAHWRAKFEDVAEPEELGTQISEPNILPYSANSDRSAAQMALGIKEVDDDNVTTASEPASSIANLWSKLTTPTSKRKNVNNIDSDSVKEILARSTFH